MSTCSKGAVYLVWLAAIISVFLLLSAPLPTFAANDIVSVAVLDFQVGNIPYWWNWRLEKEITEMVTDGLTGKGEYRLLERSHIDKILREQNFRASGRVDATTAAKMGKLLGADAVIMGTITDFSMTSSGKTARWETWPWHIHSSHRFDRQSSRRRNRGDSRLNLW